MFTCLKNQMNLGDGPSQNGETYENIGTSNPPNDCPSGMVLRENPTKNGRTTVFSPILGPGNVMINPSCGGWGPCEDSPNGVNLVLVKFGQVRVFQKPNLFVLACIVSG